MCRRRRYLREPDLSLGDPARVLKSKQRAITSQESKEADSQTREEAMYILGESRGDDWSEGDNVMASTQDGDALPSLLHYSYS